MKCNQPAIFRYTWAGQDETVCCREHGQQIQAVALAIGYHCQLIPLSESDLQMGMLCSNNVGEDKDE